MSELDSIITIDNTLIASIDPGKTGAIICYRKSFGFRKLDVFQFPHVSDFLDILAETDRWDFHIYVERQQCSPRQGVSAAFQTGFGYGQILGWFEAFGIDITLVQPKKWMAFLGVKGGQERKARKQNIEELVKPFYPEVDTRGSRGGLLDGISDALGIMHYGAHHVS